MKVYKLVYLILDINESNVKIFNEYFVRIHKNHCKIIYKNKIYKLSTEFNCEDKKSEYLKIKLLSPYDIPDIDIAITDYGQILEFSDGKRNYKKALKPGNIVKRSYYDVSLLAYRINQKEKRIKIFGENFVKNNKDKYFIKHKEKRYDLKEYFKINDFTEDLLYIVLIGLEKKSDRSYMFHNCNLLEYYYIFADNKKKKNVLELK